ncbi:MAG TPA: M20/M25/M40 family metallo-hydrolase [Gemmatimonadota bacterium]|nr:M20/M25/M40 family metallo-hydrolase [Gemmatimonadota bacterium]
MTDCTESPPVAALLAPLLAAMLAGACAGGPRTATDPDVASLDEAAATITAEDMFGRITALAHDSMMGRDTPSPGLESAARYIAGEFASFGLEPAGDGGTYLQRYPLPLRTLDTEGVHFGTVNGAGGENRMLRYGVDFFAAPAGEREGVDMFHGTFHWVGRVDEGGLPEFEYGPRTLIVTGIPGGFDRDWRTAVARARRAAQEIDASGLLVVLGPEFDAAMIERMAGVYGRPTRSLVEPREIPVFFVTPAAWASILEREGLAPGALPAAPGEPLVFENVRSHFQAMARVVEDAHPPNVVGLLRGSDPGLANTYVVFSAHMDHVGVGAADGAGDSLYNGADDNASGTAALIEVAQAFAALEEPPARTLVFLAVSGEEKGLLGSRWYSDHPTVPLEGIVANVNVDMIGRNAPDSIVAIGIQYSSLGPLVERVAAENPGLGLTVVDDPWPEERFFFRSDHFNFARKEIPALFFFAGVHADYHRPSDHAEKIDADKAARVARLIFRTAHAVAESAEPPQWTPEGLAEVRALTR